MMVAEKAADLILDNTPLAPAAAGFYRHRGADAERSASR
jgi:choline dehydrogenase